MIKIAAAALAALFTAAATSAFSAGFQQISVPDEGHAALIGGVWYPSRAPAPLHEFNGYEQTVAVDGPIAITGKAPLIVISHGSGGAVSGHYDTAIALAEAGFIVVGVDHNGDNYLDHSGFTRLDRPRHIKATIDYMLTAWPGHDAIDPERIGIYGFSAGGLAALVAIGGNPDASLIEPYCQAHPDEWACRMAKDHLRGAMREPGGIVHDPRIKAAVVAAPAVGFSFAPGSLSNVTVPIQLWRGDHDEILPHPRHAQNVYDNLPTKPEYHVVPNAGHFAFIAPCLPSLASRVPFICHDPEGFDRATFHQEFNPSVVAFFKAKLPER